MRVAYFGLTLTSLAALGQACASTSPGARAVPDLRAGAASVASSPSKADRWRESAPAAQCLPSGVMPAGAPSLQSGTWVDITPPGITKGTPETCIGQGLIVDPCHTGTIYWGITPYDQRIGGVYKSVNGGGAWKKVGHLDEPVRLRIDPKRPNHLYAGDGVRGATMGFWVSWDAGETWTKPRGWLDVAAAEHVFVDDVYDVAVDPTDFNHVLVSSHSPYGRDTASYGRAAGIVESKDGGDSWTVHKPQPSWGYGHSIDFLYDPEKKIGDANTWLLGTQADGIWRTSDAGATWTKVSEINILHGGDSVYYGSTGVLYTASTCGVLRSEDNGKTWTAIGIGGANSTVYGDGTLLYTAVAYLAGPRPILTSAESDGRTWAPMNGGAQLFTDGGPYEMAFDAKSRTLYSSNWMQGIWALRVAPWP